MQILAEKELAVRLHLPYSTIRKMRIGGGLPHFRVGRRVFYRLEAVENWMMGEEARNASAAGVLQPQAAM